MEDFLNDLHQTPPLSDGLWACPYGTLCKSEPHVMQVLVTAAV